LFRPVSASLSSGCLESHYTIINMYPILQKSYKDQFPFRLGTTSFIYPDHYAQNVNMLGPFFDEIELLFFESRFENSLPSKKDIQELKDLSEKHGITYNIHLPVDISLGDSNIAIRRHAVDTINRFIERTKPLSPSTNTLHLVQPEHMEKQTDIDIWLDSLCWSMERVVGKEIHGKDISIENLFYPMKLIENIIYDFQLSVCIDIGHLILSKHDIEKNFDAWMNRTTIIHLHGVDDGKDHLSLDRTPPKQMKKIITKLQKFTGTVSLEIFSFSKLVSSIKTLENIWK
jgi:sugar phosphate isomerase/epimerase